MRYIYQSIHNHAGGWYSLDAQKEKLKRYVEFQRMQDFGVNLICVEDGIDSSKDSGKLMISVLSAVVEIERENILVQTMEGRKHNKSRYNPHVFTEQGLYMLMTVLKGPLAVKQSKVM